MKILNVIEGWINSLDRKLFGKNNPNYVPVSGKTMVQVLIGAFIVGAIVSILQIFVKGDKPAVIVASIGMSIVMIVMIWGIVKGCRQIRNVWKCIGYVLLHLLLSTFLIQVAMWAIFLILFVLFFMIFGYFIGWGGKGKTYRIEYPDGTTEIKQAQKGVCGEDILNTSDGETHIL